MGIFKSKEQKQIHAKIESIKKLVISNNAQSDNKLDPDAFRDTILSIEFDSGARGHIYIDSLCYNDHINRIKTGIKNNEVDFMFFDVFFANATALAIATTNPTLSNQGVLIGSTSYNSRILINFSKIVAIIEV